MNGYVYKLVCPVKNEPIYVGSTQKSLHERLSGHISAIKKSKLPLYVYLRGNNIKPKMVRLQTVHVSKLRSSEKKWHDRLIKDGFALLNAKKMNKIGSGSIKISADVYPLVLAHCNKNGVVISFYVTQAVREKLQKETLN